MDNQPLYTAIVEYLKRYNPNSIAVFGSYARGDQTPASDIDILVDLGSPLTLFDLVDIERELGALLGIKVDLTTRGAVSPRLWKYIQDDVKVLYS